MFIQASKTIKFSKIFTNIENLMRHTKYMPEKAIKSYQNYVRDVANHEYQKTVIV